MESIKGKWALVTGASRGIGALVADKLADYGCNLVLHSRSVAHLDKIAEKKIYGTTCKSMSFSLVL